MENNRRHFLEGERIYLRDVNLDDANEDYYRWINDPDVTKYTEIRFYPQSIEDIKEYVEQKSKSRDSIFLAIVLKENNKHIGNIKIHRINWIHRHAEVSILIGEKSYWGQGIGTEAISLITEYAFNTLNLNKLFAQCYANNVRPIKAFGKAGFEKEASIKQHYFFQGKYVDGVMLSIINQKDAVKDES